MACLQLTLQFSSLRTFLNFYAQIIEQLANFSLKITFKNLNPALL